ncbi:MAG: hypothetical protein M1114_00110 [Candidatus Dependentiae bacterium]|nr:hypothetical protein [Candidatus Dependentiae bacterium]
MKYIPTIVLFLAIIPFVLVSAEDKFEPVACFGDMKSKSIKPKPRPNLQASQAFGASEAKPAEWHQVKAFLKALKMDPEIKDADDRELTLWIIEEAKQLAAKCPNESLKLQRKIAKIERGLNL